MNNINKYAFFTLASLTSLLGIASVFKTTGILDAEIKQVESAVGGALFLHLIGAIVLGGLSKLSQPKKVIFGVSPLTLFLVVLVTLDESSQYFFPNRNFAWFDLFVNYCGLLIGSFGMTALQRSKSR
jgi:glycopeptide antibiotics resistance protein